MDRTPRFPSLFYRQDINAFAAAFVAAVLFWQCFPALWLFLSAAVFGSAALCFVLLKDRRRACLILMAGITAGVLFAGAHLLSEPARLGQNGREAAGRGIVLSRTEQGNLALFTPDGSFLPAAVLTKEKLSVGVKFTGTVTLDASVTREERAAGASLRIKGKLTPAGSDPVLRALGAAREKCLAMWGGGSVGGFYRAALLGDRSGLSGSLKTAFRKDGVMHLLAVSGLHVSMILGAVYYSLFFLTRDRRLTRMILLILLPVTVVMTGGGLPVLRAALMTGMALIVSLSGRRPAPLTGLFLSALILAVLRPWAVGTASFLLTFTCTLAIIAVAGPLTRRLDRGVSRLPFPLRRLAGAAGGSLFISLSAFVFTLPCQAYLIGTLQPFSALYNVLFIPLFTPCVALGLLALPAAFFPALSFLKVPAEWYGKVFLSLVRFVSDGALGTTVSLGAAAPFLSLFALGVLIACFALRIRCDRFLILSLFMMGIVFLAGALF